MKRFFAAICGCFVIIILLLATGYWWVEQYMRTSGPLTVDTTIIIEPGSSSKDIANLLAAAEVIEYPDIFRWVAILRNQHHRFQAGEYLLPAFITPQEVMAKLVKGDVITHKITIAEGKTSAEIIALLNAEPLLTGNITIPVTEGRLLPETYHFTRGETRNNLLRRMAKAQDELLAKYWPTRQDNLPFSTAREAIILASIVEKEAALPQERRRIAAVYVNRLRKSMMLQADPTVAYGLYAGRSDAPALTYADLKKDTPFNTYTRAGLPPTPICNPGAASIIAVLNPIISDELYFVATGDGGHYFASTHKQHLRNVAKYRQWQRSQRRTAAINK